MARKSDTKLIKKETLYGFKVSTPFALGGSPLPSRKVQLLTFHCYAKCLKHHIIHFPLPPTKGYGVFSYFQGTPLCILLQPDSGPADPSLLTGSQGLWLEPPTLNLTVNHLSEALFKALLEDSTVLIIVFKIPFKE